MSDYIKEKHTSYATNHLKRIVLVGAAGSGKTTLAQQLSLRLHIPHIELDTLYWGGNWTQAPYEVFCERIAQVLRDSCWIIDGNYNKVRDLIWSQADTIIWLDYSLPIIIMRLLHRTIRRLLTHEEFGNGNHEPFRRTFTKDSIIIWMLKTYQKKRRDVLAAQENPAYGHLDIIHLHSPRETQEWLSHIPTSPEG